MPSLLASAALAEEFILVERATSDAVTDTGTKGDSAGDLLTFANDVYDKDNKIKLSADSGWCICTVVGKSWECFWTLQRDKGSITVHGPFLAVAIHFLRLPVVRGLWRREG